MRAPQPPPPTEVHRPELWVDAFSAPGGDGTRAAPFKTLPRPLQKDALVHLRSGLYAGSIELEAGVTLRGEGEVVLTGEAGQTVVTARGGALENLAVQGGALGLDALGQVVAKGVRFSGQRQRAVHVQGTLELIDARLESTVEGIDGVVVERGASLVLTRGTFTGGFKVAVATEGGRLSLTALSSEGPRMALRALQAETDVAGLSATGGSGSALFFAGGQARLSKVQVTGHEYALLASNGAVVKATDLRARGAVVACVATSQATLELEQAVLWDCGQGGALELLDSKSVVRRLEVKNAKDLGVFVRQGALSLHEATITRVSGADGVVGDALHVRDAKVSGTGALFFSELDGSGVFASNFAEVTLEQVTVERARSSAFFVDRKSLFTVGKALVRGGGGPALVVPSDARARFESLFVAGGTESPVYAECSDGAEVLIGRLESTVAQVPSRCVGVTAPR